MTHMKKREGRIGKNYEKYYRSTREQLYNKFWTILTHFIGLSWAIFCCIWLSLPISGYLGLYLAISGCLSLSLIISVCFRPVKDESLGLVSVSRLKVPRLLVSSRSRTKFLNWSRLGLVLDEKFWDSLVSVSSRLLPFYSVSSWSRPDQDV